MSPSAIIICEHCGEAVLSRERAPNLPLHEDCLLRLCAGGVNHQRETCRCFGGTQPQDPPSLTRREAARVAAMHHERARASSPTYD